MEIPAAPPVAESWSWSDDENSDDDEDEITDPAVIALLEARIKAQLKGLFALSQVT